MTTPPQTRCWLIVNPASGSNDTTSTETVAGAIADRGWGVERVIAFPDEALPGPDTLDAAGIDLVVVYAGDGSVNALINGLSGWGGQVLVLPGGTMNLLARRLHRALEVPAILDIVAGGGAAVRRPACVRCEAGVALAGLLAGPGTCWSRVRESMRKLAIADMATEALDAVRQSNAGPFVVAQGNRLAREGGYPMVELTPGEHGVQIDGYYAEDVLDYAGQAWAALKRRFREGPHDRLGLSDAITLESIDGSPLALLIDGEPAEAPSPAHFTLMPCGVDLLASAHDL